MTHIFGDLAQGCCAGVHYLDELQAQIRQSDALS
jgi:hypothetical protein